MHDDGLDDWETIDLIELAGVHLCRNTKDIHTLQRDIEKNLTCPDGLLEGYTKPKWSLSKALSFPNWLNKDHSVRHVMHTLAMTNPEGEREEIAILLLTEVPDAA